MKRTTRLPGAWQKWFILVSLLLTACGQMTVTGVSQGEIAGETAVVSTLQLKRGQTESVNRVQTFPGQPPAESVAELAMRLGITQRDDVFSSPETYIYLAFSSLKDEIAGGLADDPGYIPNHAGKLTYLTIRHGDSAVSAVPQQLNEAHVGAAWLASVEDNDRRIPWQITPGAGDNCFP